MICRNCGQKLPEENLFCEYCGAPVNEALPEREPVTLQSNRFGIPDNAKGAGIPQGVYNQEQKPPKKSKKAWVWIILVVLIILGCGCVAFAGGGLIFLRNRNLPLKDQILGLINVPIPDEETPVNPQVEVPEIKINTPEDTILVATNSAIWAVNEQSHEATQISNNQVDSIWDIEDGLSPDKKYFAFVTGFNGASLNPILVVLSIENMSPVLQLELTGPGIQPGMDDTHGDPAFEAFGAMQFENNLAWSPDSTWLAFIAARDGDSADVYLFNSTDKSVSHLSNEDGQAAALHWSPDGQLLQYLSVNLFGTGAGSDMEGLWVYDFQSKQVQLLEKLDSNGEDFLAWEDNNRFWINSFSRTCGGAYNLRIVNAISHDQQVIVDGGFTAVAYDPENTTGLFSVAYKYDNCGNGDPMDEGIRIFGEGIGYTVDGGIGVNNFEQVIAYDIGFFPHSNLFSVYGDEGLQYIYTKGQYGYNNLKILPEVKGLVPYPSPTGVFWAWASRNKAGLWVTENNSNPVELSSNFSGVPLWSPDGQIIYFYENSQLFSANAPQYDVNLVGEFPGEDILGVIK